MSAARLGRKIGSFVLFCFVLYGEGRWQDDGQLLNRVVYRVLSALLCPYYIYMVV